MVLRLVIAVGVLLALPGTALAITVEGPTSVNENAGKASYEVTCGTMPNLVPTLPPVPYTGTVNITVEPEPGARYGAPTDSSHDCSAVTPNSFSFDIPITDNTADDGNQDFKVTATGLLADPSTDSVTTTIVDNDPIASIVPVVFVTEGQNDTAKVLVTLSSAPAGTMTIPYATQDLTASAGSDYTFTSGTLAFAAGETSKAISVPIIDDSGVEGPEALLVDLGNPSNGTLSPTAKQAAIGIFSDDVPPEPAASISRTVTVEEGNRGTVNALFEVALSFVPTKEVRVSWRTLDWTATGADYESKKGTLVFAAGQRTKSVSVDVNGDKNDEPDEAFGITLENPVAATLAATKSGFGIITDDDGPKVRIRKPKARKRVIVTKLGCPDASTQCIGELVIKMGRKRVGKAAAFDLAKGTESKVRVRMSRKARRKLQKRARKVRLIVTARDASGDERRTKRKVRLKRLG